MNNEGLALDVDPQLLPAPESPTDLVVGDLDQLDWITREPPSMRHPMIDAGTPLGVVLLDGGRPHEDHVEIALSIGVAPSKGTEDQAKSLSRRVLFPLT